jgi:hypothetical protein
MASIDGGYMNLSQAFGQMQAQSESWQNAQAASRNAGSPSLTQAFGQMQAQSDMWQNAQAASGNSGYQSLSQAFGEMQTQSTMWQNAQAESFDAGYEAGYEAAERQYDAYDGDTPYGYPPYADRSYGYQSCAGCADQDDGGDYGSSAACGAQEPPPSYAPPAPAEHAAPRESPEEKQAPARPTEHIREAPTRPTEQAPAEQHHAGPESPSASGTNGAGPRFASTDDVTPITTEANSDDGNNAINQYNQDLGLINGAKNGTNQNDVYAVEMQSDGSKRVTIRYHGGPNDGHLRILTLNQNGDITDDDTSGDQKDHRVTNFTRGADNSLDMQQNHSYLYQPSMWSLNPFDHTDIHHDYLAVTVGANGSSTSSTDPNAVSAPL